MDKKPNIVLITIDALRADHLGFMGYEKNISPNIDALAKQSCVFTNAFSVGPVTSYSFPSILTSTYSLDSQEPRKFISEVLKSNGFITAAFHSSPYLSDYFGYNKGWDYFEDITLSNDFSSTGFFSKTFRKISMFTFPRFFFWFSYLRYKLKGPNKTKVRASFVNKIVKDFIYSVKEESKPFFVWIHYMDVHSPPPCYFKGKGACSYSELIGDYLSSAVWTYGNKGALKRFIKKDLKKHIEKTISSYDLAIEFLDKEIGELLEFLKKQELFENSIICLAADHGDEFLDHESIGHNIQLYNELLHVPLLIRKPETENRVIESKVSLIDLAPTLCDLVQIKPHQGFKGENLFNKQKEIIFHQSGSSGIACQFNNWKYILNQDTKKEELYNLSNDSKEQNNLVDSESKVCSQMRKIIQEFKYDF